ncbi:hypothetical protein A8926_1912 [Saccharopolyspora spinosa]|uniref:DUF3039 family protein n=1 Tax=Saccharopolyspora spinosa TaxID=60894 RepID=A0A2N3XUH3_SACSN|nr:hypothetical protein A8926_1912 [Saccharopolyspora spinosa]
MSDDRPAVCPAPSGYWVAFGYQNHVILTKPPKRKDHKLPGLCGVLARPEEMSNKDERPDCAWCAEQAHTGQVRIVPRPDTV